MSVKEIQNNTLPTVDTDKFMVVDFMATWCPPCKMMKPIFHSIAEEKHLQDVEFISVDIDQNQELAHKFGVMSIPTFAIFQNKGGEMVEIKRMVGGQDPLTFKMEIEKAIQK